MVEEALGEHATMFYKTDSRLNPSPYRDLWADWTKNDEERERCVGLAGWLVVVVVVVVVVVCSNWICVWARLCMDVGGCGCV
jgi:hypothetical protein